MRKKGKIERLSTSERTILDPAIYEIEFTKEEVRVLIRSLRDVCKRYPNSKTAKKAGPIAKSLQKSLLMRFGVSEDEVPF